MTVKDYNLIAEVFRCNKPLDPDRYRVWLHLVRNMSNKLKCNDPRFKFNQFFDACGV